MYGLLLLLLLLFIVRDGDRAVQVYFIITFDHVLLYVIILFSLSLLCPTGPKFRSLVCDASYQKYYYLYYYLF